LSSTITSTAPVNFVNCTVRKGVNLYGHHQSNLDSIDKRPGGFPWDWKLEMHKGDRAEWYAERKSILRSAGGAVSLPTFQLSGVNVSQMCNITALMTNFLDIHPQDKPKRNWHR
jgi:hypothetical protein